MALRPPSDVIINPPGLSEIKKILTAGPSVQQQEGNPKQVASRTQRSSQYQLAQAMKAMNQLTSMGGFPFIGDLKNAVKFAQQVGAPEQFAKSFDMATNLLKTATSGQNILANLSVGGQQNISAALSAASAFQAATKKQNDADAKDPYEEFLKALYREVTKLEPLDSNEKPTPEYKLWKALYLLALELAVSEQFLDACRAIVAINKFNLAFLQNFNVNSLVGT
jgi:uncharacterized protein YjgD (DUF1641 family)